MSVKLILETLLDRIICCKLSAVPERAIFFTSPPLELITRIPVLLPAIVGEKVPVISVEPPALKLKLEVEKLKSVELSDNVTVSVPPKPPAEILNDKLLVLFKGVLGKFNTLKLDVRINGAYTAEPVKEIFLIFPPLALNVMIPVLTPVLVGLNEAVTP